MVSYIQWELPCNIAKQILCSTSTSAHVWNFILNAYVEKRFKVFYIWIQ